MTGTRLRPAVFLDRDGTLIEHVHFLADPALVRLSPGAGDALRRLHREGFACVLATNQSGIGRGLFAEARLHEVHAELARQLAAEDTTLDGIYYCPDAPASELDIPSLYPNRKPEPGMLLRAAAELGLCLESSWMVGDLMSDVLAGLKAGCRSILIETSSNPHAAATRRSGQAEYLSAPNLAAAADLILSAGPSRPARSTHAEPA